MLFLGGAGQKSLTLTREQLEECSPRVAGGRIRASCPFHGSDKQRSLSVNEETGGFLCHACQASGMMEEQRRRHSEERQAERRPAVRKVSLRPPPTPARDDLEDLLEQYQAALPGSWGEHYLRLRGISLELAQRYGVGYAAPGKWAQPKRDWKSGRIVFPHTTPEGRLVNLYSRAVAHNEDPGGLKHDHLATSNGSGNGWFNAPAALSSVGPLYVVEGPFDALALLAAGETAVAIFGVNGWRWEWVRHRAEVVFALDSDERGQTAFRQYAAEGTLRGKTILHLPGTAYGGHKDASAAWQAGTLTVPASLHLLEEEAATVFPGSAFVSGRPVEEAWRRLWQAAAEEYHGRPDRAVAGAVASALAHAVTACAEGGHRRGEALARGCWRLLEELEASGYEGLPTLLHAKTAQAA